MAAGAPVADPEGMRRLALLAVTTLFLALAGPAAGSGGHYVFDGGTRAERAQARAAIAASTFDFDLVSAQITIHIRRGVPTQSLRGDIWLNARLLDAGRFSWATVQDEYAHQIDFFLLDDMERQLLLERLGGLDWCYSVRGLHHSDYGCERFTSVFAWAYWPSKDNAYKPTSAHDESAAMPAASFRALLGSMIGFADPLA